MSHVYSRQHIRSSRSTPSKGELAYQRHFPHFDLNSRAVKLPPIIKNELLVGRVGQAVVPPSQGNSHLVRRSNETLRTVSFPKIPDALSQNIRNGSASPRHKAESTKTLVKHVEKAPINFPNSYTVLPPIGKTSLWRAQNGYSSVQLPPRNGGKVPISVQDQMKSRRRMSPQRKRSDHGLLPPSPTTVNSSDPARNKESISTTSFVEISTAVEDQNQTEKRAVFVSDTSTAKSTSAEDAIDDNEQPSLSNEDIEMTECDTVHVLEKLELTKEAQEFLESDQSKRRPATCIEIDSSLKKAVDIIRDNLLRQTMEELCMMW